MKAFKQSKFYTYVTGTIRYFLLDLFTHLWFPLSLSLMLKGERTREERWQMEWPGEERSWGGGGATSGGRWERETTERAGFMELDFFKTKKPIQKIQKIMKYDLYIHMDV